MLENFYYVMDVGAFLCCLVTYKSLPGNFKWFLPYLAFQVVYGLLNTLNWLIINKTNAWCNNLQDIVEFLFFAYFIISFDNLKKRRKAGYIITGIIVVLSFIDIFYIQGFWKRSTIAIVMQNLFGLWLICNYYYRLLNDDSDEQIDLVTYPPFLALTGMFFYYLAMTFYYSCFSYMVYKNNYHFYLLASTLLDINSFMMNCLLSFSFICCFKKKNLSSL